MRYHINVRTHQHVTIWELAELIAHVVRSLGELHPPNKSDGAPRKAIAEGTDVCLQGGRAGTYQAL